MQLNRNPALGKHLSLQSGNWMECVLQKGKGAARCRSGLERTHTRATLPGGATAHTRAEETPSGIHRHTRPQFQVSLSKEK